jgi:hypothetical protein
MSTTPFPAGAVPGIVVEEPAAPVTAQSKLDEAVELIIQAQRFNSNMQRKHKLGSVEWHEHEAIDDRLHDALAALGQ